MFYPFPISTSLTISTITYVIFTYIRYVVTTNLNKDRKFTSNLVDSIHFLSIYYVCSYAKHWVYNNEPNMVELTMIELIVYQ